MFTCDILTTLSNRVTDCSTVSLERSDRSCGFWTCCRGAVENQMSTGTTAYGLELEVWSLSKA